MMILFSLQQLGLNCSPSLYKRTCSPWIEGIREIQISESTLWSLQSIELFFTGYLRGTVEWGVQRVKGLGFGILNLSGLSLYHCTQYFSIVKKKTGSCPMDVSILSNHINYLCTCMIGVCSLVLSFQTCLSHKRTGGEIGCQLNYQFFPTIGIQSQVTFLGLVSGHVGFGVVSLSATLDVRHSWNVERLTNEKEFGQCEETHK
jgi:hypothetical protein